jgi:hypothetical protein
MRQLFLFSLFIMLLSGCGLIFKGESSMAGPAIEGYVTVAETGRYLVVRNKPVHLNEANPQFVEAIWVSTDELLEIGDYVKVWADAINESYPGQTSADHLKILSKNFKSTLSIKEVITVVAEILENNPIITNINYDAGKKQWTLHYQDTVNSTGLIGMIIKDKKPLTLEEPIYEQPPEVKFGESGKWPSELYLQRYDWTYLDILSGQEKQIEYEIPILHVLPSSSEAAAIEKQGEIILESGGLEILHSEIIFMDKEMNEITKIIDGKGDIPKGVYYMQATIEFEQGTAVYVNTVNIK